eukprot:Seg2838.3 transcript_id=Seg2838.3/GoldUCD/mRNA.D3Y31 product="Phosphatidylinositol N-acetylglucosaminyltransferase subunit H" protein_id=Seg2838.3/GoldUCD/D3Y31
MEEDSSYSVKEATNISGKVLRINRTYRQHFCHYKIQCCSGCGCWTKLGPFINKLLMLSCLCCPLANRYLDLQMKYWTWITFVLIHLMLYIYFNNWCLLEENFICVKDLGIQISSVYFTGKTTEEFIPQKDIADVVINEVIYMQRIIYVLVILIGERFPQSSKTEVGYSNIERAKTVFKETKPRLAALTEVLQETHRIMFLEEKLES